MGQQQFFFSRHQRIFGHELYYSRTSTVTEPSGSKGVRKSEISMTLKSSAYLSRFDAVLYIFHDECAAVITMEYNLAYIEAKA